jgi:hypothetical protein
VVDKRYPLIQIEMRLQEGWLHLPETEQARRLAAAVKAFQVAPRETRA